MTSYTTIYQCSKCSQPGPIPQTLCSVKFCSINGQISTTEYAPDEFAIASITNGNIIQSTNIPGSECSSYLSFNTATISPNGLLKCGLEPYVTCQSKLCISSDTISGRNPPTTQTLPNYNPGESAPALINGILTTVLAQSCDVYTTSLGVKPTVLCTGNIIQSGYTVITYTYTTNGATIVSVTSIPPRGGNFQLLTSQANKFEGLFIINCLFWLWTITAIIGGIGMILL